MARQSIETFIDMSNRKDKAALQQMISPLVGEYEVKLIPRRAMRSNQQNRYYHGCLVQALYDFLRQQDFEITSKDQCHEFIKAKLLTVDVCDPRTGEVIGTRVRSTTELDTAQFSKFVDDARIWLSDFFGIVVPDPVPLSVGKVGAA